MEIKSNPLSFMSFSEYHSFVIKNGNILKRKFIVRHDMFIFPKAHKKLVNRPLEIFETSINKIKLHVSKVIIDTDNMLKLMVAHKGQRNANSFCSATKSLSSRHTVFLHGTK